MASCMCAARRFVLQTSKDARSGVPWSSGAEDKHTLGFQDVNSGTAGIAQGAMPIISLLPGIVSPGRALGARTIMTAKATRTSAVPYVTVRRHGSVFSTAISALTTAIQTMLITPSAKSEAMSAQQHAT